MSGIIGQSLKDCRYRWYLVCNGDDAIVFTDIANSEATLASIRIGMDKSGFELGAPKIVRVFENIEFDQCSPVRVNEDNWVMIRQPMRILEGLLYTTRRLNYTEYLEWLLAVAQGEHALNYWVPLIGQLTANIIRVLSDRGVRHVDLERFDRHLQFRFNYQQYGRVEVDQAYVRSSVAIKFPSLMDLESSAVFVCPEPSEFGSPADPWPTLITPSGALII